VRDVSVEFCSVNATGWALGGALLMGSSDFKYGFDMYRLSLRSTLASCSTFTCFALGGGVFSHQVSNANITLSTFSNVGARAQADYSQAAGAGFFISGVSGFLNLSSCSFSSTFLRVLGFKSYGVGGMLALPASGVTPVEISNSVVFNSSIYAAGEESAAVGGGVFNYARFNLTNATISGCNVACEGVGCFAAGGAYVALNNGLSLLLATTPSLIVHASVFSNNSVSCNSTGPSRCAAQGGALFFATNAITPRLFVATMISSTLLSGNLVVCSQSIGSVSNGGAISCNSCSGYVTDSLLQNNSARSGSADVDNDIPVDVSGGGLYVSLQAAAAVQLAVTNTSFVSNYVRFHSAGLSGVGGGATVGFQGVVTLVDCSFLRNAAHNGGGLAVESQGNANVTGSVFLNNSLHFFLFQDQQSSGLNYYSSRGSAIYSANPSISSNSSSSSSANYAAVYPVALRLHNVIIAGSEGTSLSASAGAMGSLVFLVGVSQFFAANTSVQMHRAATALYVSGVESGIAGFTADLTLSCSRGYLLQRQVVASSLLTTSSVPGPNTLFPPVPVSMFTKLSGLSASCNPCPTNTYSFQNSVSSAGNDSVCTECPFGAVCNGTWVTALPGFWGWIVAPTATSMLADFFVLLPDGYGCGSTQPCRAYNQCVPSRSGILCGSCSAGFTRSLLSQSCVSISSCSAGTTAAWVVFALFLLLIYAAVIVFPRQASSSGLFQTLMWFYQISGLLLSGSNSLDLVPGIGSFTSIISMVFSASPRASSSASFSGLCLVRDMSQVEILMVGVLCHAVLLAFVLILSLNCVWLRCDAAIQTAQGRLESCFGWLYQLAFACMRDMGSSSVKKYEVSMVDNTSSPGIDYVQHERVSVEVGDSRMPLNADDKFHPQILAAPLSFHKNIGRSLIMLLLTVYVSTMTALVECTSCQSVPGYPVPAGESENRWYLDGTQQCTGWRFALASVILVPLSSFPLLLLHRMRKWITIDAKEAEGSLSPIQTSALSYCTCLFLLHVPSNFFDLIHRVILASLRSKHFQIASHFARTAATGW
jgi:hypothetical protein